MPPESKDFIEQIKKKIENNKNLYSPKKRGEIRKEFYENGVDVTYITKNKDGSIKKKQTIHYEMLFRTPAKAKVGQVITYMRY